MNKVYSKIQTKRAFEDIGLDYHCNSNCFDMARRGFLNESVASLMAGSSSVEIRKAQKSFRKAIKR